MSGTKLNRPLEKLAPDIIRKHIKAVTFDIDGVIVPTGTYLRESIDGTELTIKTHKLSVEMVDLLIKLKKYIWLNFSSGRALLYLQNMLGDILWDQVSLTAENGNFILINGKFEQVGNYTQKYLQKITDIKQDLKKLQAKHPENIHGFEPKQMIISIHTAKPMPEVEAIVKQHDRENELYCLWTSEGYDIGNIKTNKETALKYLCQKLKIQPAEMITTGNNLNDKEMLDFGIGVSVDQRNIDGMFAIPPQKKQLGGEILAKYLLNAFTE